ncbi:MAG: AIR synthase-related protein, partial [Acidimicrobiales bacterium]
VLLGLRSPGLRSNGYSLARHVLIERAGRDLGSPAWSGAARSLGEELLEPSVLYAPGVVRVRGDAPGALHACAHVTGGGLAANLARVLPETLDASIDRSTWVVPPIFAEIASVGDIADEEMARVFNLGVGMVLAVDRSAAPAVGDALEAEGLEWDRIGELVGGTGEVHLR